MSKSWDDIIEGSGGRTDRREERIVDWDGAQLSKEFAEGYERFFKRRKMKPPPVSREVLNYGDDV